jgi:HlyD family secretion protein
MKNSVFRKVSLERLSSPEQLDQLMQVTTSKGWIALTALAGLLVVAVIWGFTGRIPTRVQGMGVLIKTGGVFEVVALTAGQVVDIAVRPGDLVQEGQVVARLEQPTLLDQIKQARARLEEARLRHQQQLAFGQTDRRLQTDLAREQQGANLQALAGLREQVSWLEERIENQTQLFEQGLINKQVLLTSKQQLQSTQERIEQLENEQRQITIREQTQHNQREQALVNSTQQINDLEREIALLEDQMEAATQVVSPYTGRILEVMAEVGTLIGQGRPILRLDRVGDNVQDLEAVLYLPATEGKKVKPGMDVQISPTIVKREEHGFMLGRVTRISDFPSTPDGMMRILKNNGLVETLSGGGAPYETYATLQLDPATFSGYQWSSEDGPDLKIQSGTLCSATVTVAHRRPIDMVLPVLKRFTGVGV